MSCDDYHDTATRVHLGNHRITRCCQSNTPGLINHARYRDRRGCVEGHGEVVSHDSQQDPGTGVGTGIYTWVQKNLPLPSAIKVCVSGANL